MKYGDMVKEKYVERLSPKSRPLAYEPLCPQRIMEEKLRKGLVSINLIHILSKIFLTKVVYNVKLSSHFAPSI